MYYSDSVCWWLSVVCSCFLQQSVGNWSLPASTDVCRSPSWHHLHPLPPQLQLCGHWVIWPHHPPLGRPDWKLRAHLHWSQGQKGHQSCNLHICLDQACSNYSTKGCVHAGFCSSRSRANIIWLINCLKAEISWLNESGMVCSCLDGMKTCSHMVL